MAKPRAPMRPAYARLAFFALGVTTVGVSFALTIFSDELSGRMLMRTMQLRPPAWLRVLTAFAEWLPWLAMGVLAALRLAGRRSVRPIAFAGGVLVAYAASVGSLLLGPKLDDYRHRQRFEPVAWRRNAAPEPAWPARLRMVDDLMAHHRLRGLTRDSVERLLGPRDTTDIWPEWDLVYRLGPERGLFSIDDEWLVLRMDRDGRVRDYRIVRD
ncbi:MAG TPA: hypothetical protein VJT67_04695 [Longimicrobiaceae bacterium]|nr:hypothetical protein [Longimicrobiaceae bacterium]